MITAMMRADGAAARHPEVVLQRARVDMGLWGVAQIHLSQGFNRRE
jgi:hypothetical protein